MKVAFNRQFRYIKIKRCSTDKLMPYREDPQTGQGCGDILYEMIINISNRKLCKETGIR